MFFKFSKKPRPKPNKSTFHTTELSDTAWKDFTQNLAPALDLISRKNKDESISLLDANDKNKECIRVQNVSSPYLMVAHSRRVMNCY